jgi:hypothetical protein
MEFMREGGMNMWLLVIIAVVAGLLGAIRPAAERPRVLTIGVMALLVSGMLGMATGLQAVSANYTRFPDKLEAIGQGLGELSHNGTLAAVLAAALGIAALVTTRRANAA